MNASDLAEKILTSARSITIDGSLYYIVENDHKILETQVLAYAQSIVGQSSSQLPGKRGHSELVSATEDGRKMRWKAPTVLTWKLDRPSFEGDETRMANALEFCTKAAKNWNDAAWEKGIFDKIHFQEVADDESAAFLVSFYPFGAETGLLALAFFPNAPLNERVIYVGPLALDSFVGYDQVGVIRHELGHLLGFRHEQIRDEAMADMTAEEIEHAEQWVTGGIGGEAITKYDGQSVMHYPIDPEKGIGTFDFELSEIDKEGFHALYSAPYDPATIREFTV